MTLNEKIKAIHASSLFGSIIESGCGACIANALYKVEDASHTIYYTSQPYSKEYQETLYQSTKGTRSVSPQFVKTVLEDEYDILKDLTDKVNFILVSSFQIQGTGKKNLTQNLTHGWIGLLIPETESEVTIIELYHVSIPFPPAESDDYYGDDDSRANYFEVISEIVVDLLYSKTDADQSFSSPYVDNFMRWEAFPGFPGKIRYQLHKERKRLLGILNSQEKENFLVFNESLASPGMEQIRFEDVCRDKPGIILMKGSFNPIHARHVELMEESRKLYPDYNYAFYISIGNTSKPSVELDDLLTRIEKINSLGYMVVVSKEGRFLNNISWIRQRWKCPVIFPVGYDTINRFADDTVTAEIDLDQSIQEIGDKMRAKLPHLAKYPKRKKLSTDEIMEKAAFRLFKENKLDGVKFLVFHRKDMELNENTKYFFDLIQVETETKDVSGISSSKIRSGEIENKI
jgi:hypothetical protein